MDQQAKWFEKAALTVSSVLLGILFLLLLADVVLRWLKIEFYWGSEAGGILSAWLIILALPMVIRKRGHLAVDMIVNAMPWGVAQALKVLGGALMIAYLAVLIWYCGKLGYANYLSGVRSQGILRIPVFIVETGIVAGFALMIISQALQMIEDVRRLAGRGEDST